MVRRRPAARPGLDHRPRETRRRRAQDECRRRGALQPGDLRPEVGEYGQGQRPLQADHRHDDARR